MERNWSWSVSGKKPFPVVWNLNDSHPIHSMANSDCMNPMQLKCLLFFFVSNRMIRMMMMMMSRLNHHHQQLKQHQMEQISWIWKFSKTKLNECGYYTYTFVSLEAFLSPHRHFAAHSFFFLFSQMVIIIGIWSIHSKTQTNKDIDGLLKCLAGAALSGSNKSVKRRPRRQWWWSSFHTLTILYVSVKKSSAWVFWIWFSSPIVVVVVLHVLHVSVDFSGCYEIRGFVRGFVSFFFLNFFPFVTSFLLN